MLRIEESDAEALAELVRLTAILASNLHTQRRIKYRHDRINWVEHINMCRHTGGFESRYHMTEASFKKLLEILRPRITSNELQSFRSTAGNDPITPEMTVGAGLRFLGGEYQKSIADVYGLSLTSCQRIVNNFLSAADTNSHFDIKIPTSEAELQKRADEWNRLSGASGLYYGVVGAIDGWLACIQKPSVPHPADYFSGHYQRYGLNVQAVCDSNLRFFYFAVAGTGRTNDARVFNRCLALREWLDSIPNQYFIVGDNAYNIGNKLLIPFSGASKHRLYNRSYNFYLSQLRI